MLATAAGAEETIGAAQGGGKNKAECTTAEDWFKKEGFKAIEGSLPGSSVPGILQARTVEWVAISFSNA